MARLARRLGFESIEITSLISQSPDRLIAQHALLKARKPDCFVYDDSIFDSLIERIVSCFAAARSVDDAMPQPVLMSPSVKQRSRCGHPTVEALSQARSLLFLDRLDAIEMPDRVTTFFVRHCVYLAFFGPQSTSHQTECPPPCNTVDPRPELPMSPLFVPERTPMDDLSREQDPQGQQDNSPSPARLEGPVVTDRVVTIDDQETDSATSPAGESGMLLFDNMEQTPAPELADEQERDDHEVELLTTRTSGQLQREMSIEEPIEVQPEPELDTGRERLQGNAGRAAVEEQEHDGHEAETPTVKVVTARNSGQSQRKMSIEEPIEVQPEPELDAHADQAAAERQREWLELEEKWKAIAMQAAEHGGERQLQEEERRVAEGGAVAEPEAGQTVEGQGKEGETSPQRTEGSDGRGPQEVEAEPTAQLELYQREAGRTAPAAEEVQAESDAGGLSATTQDPASAHKTGESIKGSETFSVISNIDLDEILQGDAQDRLLWEAERAAEDDPGQTQDEVPKMQQSQPSIQEEEGAMAASDPVATGRQGNVQQIVEPAPPPPQPGMEAGLAQPSRPVTQFDLQGLLARWHEHAENRPQLPKSEQRGRRMGPRPGGIRKSRMGAGPTPQAPKHKINRVEAIRDHFGWELEDDEPTGTATHSGRTQVGQGQGTPPRGHAGEAPLEEMTMQDSLADPVASTTVPHEKEKSITGVHQSGRARKIQKKRKAKQTPRHVTRNGDQARETEAPEPPQAERRKTPPGLESTATATTSLDTTHQRDASQIRQEEEEKAATERERLQRQAEERATAERAEQVQLQREADKRAVEQAEQERLRQQEAKERERLQREAERAAAEIAKQERLQREEEEKATEQAEQERLQQEAELRAAAERAEQERLQREAEEKAAQETRLQRHIEERSAAEQKGRQQGKAEIRAATENTPAAYDPTSRYPFREVPRSALTDPNNTVAESPWPSQLAVPSRETEQGQAADDDMISITLYVYERNEWKVDRVIAVDPSNQSPFETAVWKYKRRDMFVYDMKMQTVGVASSFRAATADGNNALLLVPRLIRENMDLRQVTRPPETSKRRKGAAEEARQQQEAEEREHLQREAEKRAVAAEQERSPAQSGMMSGHGLAPEDPPHGQTEEAASAKRRQPRAVSAQSKPSRPLGIRKTKQKVKQGQIEAARASTRKEPATEQPQPGQHPQKPQQPGQVGLTTESGVRERHAGGTSGDESMRTLRKLLKPRIVARAPKSSVAPPPQETGAETVTIIFKARDKHGEWEKLRELEVDPSDPSEVERLAKKDARNRHAIFYDKNLRIVTPAQCFAAAVKDGTNTIFMALNGELEINEEVVASVSQALDDHEGRTKRRG
ncbi:hypothetical protein LOZ66_005608 [Ophidiomyces ophidiicola]|nr:hypothetical protein LOZ66_005608 [Ophidiomyces ophidiicola]